MKKLYSAYSDGGARGNPGPAAIGAVIFDEKKRLIAEISEFIGHATNNQAEYRALLEVLKRLSQMGAKRAHCYLDSELVVRQLNKIYKVKDPQIAKIFQQVLVACSHFEECVFIHIPRDKNILADKLVNQALDKELTQVV